MNDLISKNSQETENLGFEFAREIKNGDIICLYGDLGSGKTTFAKGLAKGLGVSQRVISPTFVLVREHRIMNHESRIKKLYHVDLYRLENEKELQNIGIVDILSDENAIVLVEWAERLGKYLPKNRYDIRFEHIEKDKRKVTIQKV